MLRRFIAFRLREGADFDIMAAVQNIASNKIMSAMCREGLREMLNLQSDDKDRESIEMIITGRSIEEEAEFVEIKQYKQSEEPRPMPIKSKPAIFIPKKNGGCER
jgi:hypothetical protein